MKLTLLILFLSAILVGATAYYAVKYSDGVITEGHYEKGIAYDKDNKILKDLNYGIKIDQIRKDNNKITLKYILNVKDKSLLDKIKISILRPAAKNDISNLRIRRNENYYDVTFNAKPKGYFLIRNSFDYDNLSIVYDKNFYVN